MGSKEDYKFMKLALKLTGKAKERTYPNPMVGCVIAKGGRIVSEGYHKKCGLPHAEVNAIRSAGGASCGATMYVTLEPCDHFGKTPPCTDSIISSGIKKVFVAMKDPNPLNSGRGIKRLKKAGIKVETGLLKNEAEKLNSKYIKFVTERIPYVTVKLAQSIDGKIAARDGSSKWISSPSSRKYVKKIRSSYSAIMIGSNTAIEDNPFLLDEKKKGYKTARIIVDTYLKTPLNSNIIKTRSKAPVIIATTDLVPKGKIDKFRKFNNVDIIVTGSKDGKVRLKELLRELAKRGIVSILVEGGGELVGSLLDGKLVDEAIFFISPLVIGGSKSSIKGEGAANIKKALSLKDIERDFFGEDIFLKGKLCSRG